LCDGRREVDGEHLGSPLRRKTGVEGGAEGVVRMGGVPDGIDARKEMGRDGRRGSELEWSKGGGVRNGVRRGRKAIVGPRGSGSRRMMERGKEEEFACKIAKGTEGIECEGGRRRTREELRWEMTGSLQNFLRAALLCTWCIKVVDDSGVSGAEWGVEGVKGTMVTLMAV
jgi:hypothetical protein